MMSVEQRLAEFSRQRTELIVRSAEQRATLEEHFHTWRLPIAIVDKGIAAWRFARARPSLLVGFGVAFAVARPRRAIKWLRRGWTLWRYYRSMASGKLS